MAVTRIATSSLKTLNKSDSFLNGNAAYKPTDYESIQTVNLTGSQSSITFSSIPGTYKHLQIRGVLRGDRANTGEIVGVQFNGDTTAANYASHRLIGDGTNAGGGPQSTGAYS